MKAKGSVAEIFYTFGFPIPITRQNKSLSFYNYRKAVSKKEIYESFLEAEIRSVKLFKTENEALEYIRSLKTNPYVASGMNVHQPAIFTVNYIGDDSQLVWDKRNIVINKGTTAQIYNFNERQVDVEFSNVERKLLIPLEGELKIHGPNQGEFSSLGKLTYSSDLGYQLENESENETEPCVLS
jgi:hypothetical protein